MLEDCARRAGRATARELRRMANALGRIIAEAVRWLLEQGEAVWDWMVDQWGQMEDGYDALIDWWNGDWSPFG